jgi:hypothetical protein
VNPRPFRGPNAATQAFAHLAKYHGVRKAVSSARLHTLKARALLKPNDSVVIGRTGDVYDEAGERLGSLTDPSDE